MAFAAKPISNPSSACFISSSSSSPAIFAVRQISIPLKPIIKLHFCSSSSSLRRKPNSRTSIWAHQDEQNSLVVVLQEDEQDLRWENETPADWEADAVGDSGTGGEEEEYSPPPEDAKVFVGNLPYDVDSEKLAHLFEKAGVVEISEVIYNRETDQSRGFGFVTMSSVEEAEKAVDMFSRYDLGGRLLTVNKAGPRGSRPERTNQPTSGASHTMYVGNLPWDMDDGRLEQVFSEHGKVVDARIVYDRESGRSRGFGFVSMSSESEMNDAIQNLDGQSLGGRTIRVNVAAERRKRGAF